jgi:uncharacterized protein YPO0396
MKIFSKTALCAVFFFGLFSAAYARRKGINQEEAFSLFLINLSTQ